MSVLNTPIDTKLYRGINLTGYPDKHLDKLGFETFNFDIDKGDKYELQVLEILTNIVSDFRRIYVVLPHFRPCIAYVVIAIKELTGQPPIIVYFKPQPSGEYIPHYVDMRSYQSRCRQARRKIRQKAIDR